MAAASKIKEAYRLMGFFIVRRRIKQGKGNGVAWFSARCNAPRLHTRVLKPRGHLSNELKMIYISKRNLSGSTYFQNLVRLTHLGKLSSFFRR